MSIGCLETALRQDKWLWQILERFAEIGLPDCWLVAGAVAQTVWNLACGRSADFGIKDVDLIYFDGQDLSAASEADHERRLRDLFWRLPMKLDVKNEARVHLWYEERFGYAIEPYWSSAAVIASFPTTATAVGYDGLATSGYVARLFGLGDLFALVVRPNKRQITRDIYEAKLARWRPIWPRLTFLPWDEAE
jgi:uncharacterized protein